MKIRIINKSIALALLTLTVGGSLNCITYAERGVEGNSNSDSPVTSQSRAFMKHIRNRRNLLQKYKSYFVLPSTSEDMSRSELGKNKELSSEIEKFSACWDEIETKAINYAKEEKTLRRMERNLKPRASETEDRIKSKKRELDRTLKEIEESMQRQYEIEVDTRAKEREELSICRRVHFQVIKSVIDSWRVKIYQIMEEWCNLYYFPLLYSLKSEDVQQMQPVLFKQYEEICIDLVNRLPEEFKFELDQFRTQLDKFENDIIADDYIKQDSKKYLNILKELDSMAKSLSFPIEYRQFPEVNKCSMAIDLIHNMEKFKNCLDAASYKFSNSVT